MWWQCIVYVIQCNYCCVTKECVFLKHARYLKCFKKFPAAHTDEAVHVIPSNVNYCHRAFIRPVLDVSAGLPFSLWAVPAEIRGLGSWKETRGSSFLPVMLSLIMNECDSGKCAPWTAEETPKSCRAPEGICLWQTTSPARGTQPVDQWVPLIKGWRRDPAPSGIMKLLSCFLFPMWKERSLRSAAVGHLSACATSNMINYIYIS